MGDRVILSDAGDFVTEILPRKNKMERPPVANIDMILVVASLVSPVVDTFTVDAFLLTAEAENIPAVICINKSDLIDDDACKRISHIYEKAGYKTVLTSALREDGIDTLMQLLQGKITALAGNSGVGKSSLLNRIGKHFHVETGAVSEKLARGKHTTRHVELFPLPIGGYILDTPGFSRIQLPSVPPENLDTLYREMRDIKDTCRFAQCAHIHEPACAVKDALEKGDIAPERYQSYCYFYEKIKDNFSPDKDKNHAIFL